MNVSVCALQTAAAGNNYVTITCPSAQTVTVAGTKLMFTVDTTVTTTSKSGTTLLSQVGPTTTTSSATSVNNVCFANPNPTLPPFNPALTSPPATASQVAANNAVKPYPFTTLPTSEPPTPTALVPNAAPLPAGCTTWVGGCITSTPLPSGAANTLADVAQYYYNTDLRTAGSNPIGGLLAGGAPGIDVTFDNVRKGSGTFPEDDVATWQHMTTFTMGLGLSGTLQYRPDYKFATTGDFAALRSGSLNWPIPVAGQASALDDLWHAAVNGRGHFFSATDPDTVVAQLSEALASVSSADSAAAAAATSNLEPIAGDNFAYTASYSPGNWSGDLQAKLIDLTTGKISDTPIWSAAGLLDGNVGAACDSRKIYLYRQGASSNLADFSWNTKACDPSGLPTGAAVTGLDATEQLNFGSTQVKALGQFKNMTDGTAGTVNQISGATGAAGANMVNFLRGQRGLEGFARNTPLLYRSRTHVLGDIVNAQPVFMGKPQFAYNDTGYGQFASNNLNRTKLVFVADNDGMLHALLAGQTQTDPLGGQEAWAFIPSQMLPNLYQLASTSYSGFHQYFVDGTPTVGDVFDPNDATDTKAGTWKTILVGGFNDGGKGYYALDVTNPAKPKGLWEFKNDPKNCFDPATPATHTGTDCHLGLTFGNPIIAKLADGDPTKIPPVPATWAVFVTSGYNNVNSPAITGDGEGYLYVLNAITGKIIYKIGNKTGDSTTPSGLGKINAFVDVAVSDNTAQRIYAGDLLGNLWRFDVNDSILPAGREAALLATLVDDKGVPQQITTKPEMASVGSPPEPMVFVATGQYLGINDTMTTQVQSIYAMKDPLDTKGYADTLRTTLNQQKMKDTTLADGSVTRTVSCVSPCGSTKGWFVDLPQTGERVNVDMKLQLGTLLVVSNAPVGNSCAIGGTSFINFFDFESGSAVSNSAGGVVGQKLADSLAVGLNVVRLPDGRTVALTTTSDARQLTIDAPFATPGPTGRRISWREIAF